MVGGKVLWRDRAPQIERIVRRIVIGLPIAIYRDVIDICGVFRVTSPGIPHAERCTILSLEADFA